jgi:hypothetical protein
MLNKILVFGWLSLTAILIIENFVVANTAFVLWNNSSKTYVLALVCTIIGAFIGYGIKWILSKGTSDDEEMDF